GPLVDGGAWRVEGGPLHVIGPVRRGLLHRGERSRRGRTPGRTHGAAEGAADVVGQCVLVSPGVRGDGEVPTVGHGGVDAAAVVGPAPLRSYRTWQDGGAVVLRVTVSGARGGLPHRDEDRVVVVAPLLGLHEFHGVVGGGAGVAPV